MSSLIQLPSGKTVIMDTWKYLNMPDHGFQDLIANDEGIFINNPFFESGREEIDPLEEIPDIGELQIEEINVEEY